MGKFIRDFLRRDDGLVAVEWVALTSGLVIGAIVIGVVVMGEAETEATGMATGIQEDGTTAMCAASGNASTYGLCAP